MEIRRYVTYNSHGDPKDYYKLVKMYKYRWMGGRVLKQMKIVGYDMPHTQWDEVIFDSIKEAYDCSQNIPEGHEMKYTTKFSLDYVESIPIDTITFTHSMHLI